MDTESILESMLSAGVLADEEDGSVHRVGVDEDFERAIEERRRELDPDDLEREATTLLPRLQTPDMFLAAGDKAVEFVAIHDVLTDTLPTEETEDISPGVLLVLDHLLHGYPRSSGGPEGFLPLREDQIGVSLSLYRKAVVYVWRDDCRTCDVMVEEFEGLIDGWPDEVARLSLFGPDAVETLRERFDVTGAPTTLFVKDGAVDSRLLGSHHQEAIVSELTHLTSRP